MESSNQPVAYEKPLPAITTLTKPFWDSCSKHALRMQFCTSCREWIWYPKAWCPSCGKRENIEWKEVSGKGTVYSFTVIRQVIDNSPAFNKDIPFVIGLIELEEGPRIYSNVTDVKPEEVKVGDKVAVYYDDVTPEVSLPKFRRTGSKP
ncbi:MAG TPA: Zn-ribbon domain-containing OB-fold protein [Nitrososphaerales archaeon]|nr:Zn-ribbon domain-containing OB-fold protein [Nitrososphaerales archaeon]